MTDETTVETDYRIHWRNKTTGKTGHETGLYSEDEANIKQGRVYWAEPVAK